MNREECIEILKERLESTWEKSRTHAALRFAIEELEKMEKGGWMNEKDWIRSES